MAVPLEISSESIPTAGPFSVKRASTRLSLIAAVLILSALIISGAQAQDRSEAFVLGLPTENDAIFHGGGAAFYQHIRRNYKGAVSFPWEGGQYGFVRNPVERGGGFVYTRFHEGIDIKPLRRDERGEPLDEVRAIAAGTVVHVNRVPGYSNYGNYVVVEHRLGGSSYYSLYGHLSSAAVNVGAAVDRGQVLGIMGYTGEGLDQSRAHVHLELNMLLSRNFESWHNHFIKNDPNRHGLYNGLNLTGLDVARYFLAQQKRPGLTVPEFLAGEETFYRVRVPASSNFDLPRRYPWLMRGNTGDAAAWEVSFNRAGVPLKVEASATAAPAPVLAYVKKQGGDYGNYSRGVLAGSGNNVRLSENGDRLMRLLIWPE